MERAVSEATRPPKGLEPKSLSRELHIGGLDTWGVGSANPQTRLKQAFSLESGAKMGRPNFEDPTPHIQASCAGVLHQRAITRQSLDGVVADNQSFKRCKDRTMNAGHLCLHWRP